MAGLGLVRMYLDAIVFNDTLAQHVQSIRAFSNSIARTLLKHFTLEGRHCR